MSGTKLKTLTNFKDYCSTLYNNVDEQTASRKYNDFVASLSQSKVARFFDVHKDKEWFRQKYHPIESQKKLNQLCHNFSQRLRIFNDLNDANYFDKLSYSIDNAAQILNLMDAIIVQLEGGPQELVEQLLSFDEVKIDNELRQRYVPIQPSSLVIEDISIETTVSQLQDICLQVVPNHPRITQLDPYYVEGGILKRKFIVFYDASVNIKDVCWKLSRIKHNGQPISVFINKPVAKRIMSVDALTNHHVSIVNDIRHAILLILNLDEHKGLYLKRKQNLDKVQDSNDLENGDEVKMEAQFQEATVDGIDNVAPLSPPGSEKSAQEENPDKPFDINTLDEENEKEKKKLFEFKFDINLTIHQQMTLLSQTKNPILREALMYLTEYIDSSQALYQLSKVPKDLKAATSGDPELDNFENDKFHKIVQIVRNSGISFEESIKFLDKLLWYLRIVHSCDYYKKTIYKQEDELTIKLGIVHLRDHSSNLPQEIDDDQLKQYLQEVDKELDRFALSQMEKYITKDEARFNYKSYGKVITDELASYAQKMRDNKSNETEEVYKCKHCTRVFQKLTDIGRHFVGKHRWAIDAIELEIDFFNNYLFDSSKLDPCPPKELVDIPPNKFAKMKTFNQTEDDSDLLQKTVEAYSKLDPFVREPAPRTHVESDPRNEMIVDYTDISFDDAI